MTQTWTYGFVYYFTFLFIIVSLFSISGVFSENQVVMNDEFSSSFGLDLNSSQFDTDSSESVNVMGSFDIRNYFKDLFSFFFFNISFYTGDSLMNYLWIVRLLFVYLPITGLLLSIWYSLPTVSG